MASSVFRHIGRHLKGNQWQLEGTQPRLKGNQWRLQVDVFFLKKNERNLSTKKHPASEYARQGQH